MIKWKGHWWGTELIAETEEDEAILTGLYERVQKEPVDTYEDGGLDFQREDISFDYEETIEKNKLVLTFNR